ncbi:hypothetical protein [Brevundimonas sp. Root1423]|uniref:hypothetical protein n=1 Tax=Brevundimonas sp. Root1423 TaxID=1736462 RepID=UPI0006F9E364|nr:hypothetical protein [Brevundimonas sp. Root1423]KQY89686.1 hypothetical protein ASD25_03805 [Brevundimonas sp. Root1423]
MIKALSLAAALALLPLSAAVAADVRGPSEDALEAAAEVFEARMEAFGERAEAIGEDRSLTETQRELRIAALWTEYQPDVNAFTAAAAQHASAIAAEALANVDVDAIVTEALAEVHNSGAFAAAQGIAANGAWASNDPEHMATYGLMAEYAVGEALDSIDEVEIQIAEANAQVAEALAEAQAEAARPDESDED